MVQFHVDARFGICANAQTSEELFPQKPVESKCAASKVENVAILRKSPAQWSGDEVFAPVSFHLRINEACFAEDAQVLGDVVLRKLQAFAQSVHAEASFQQRR